MSVQYNNEDHLELLKYTQCVKCAARKSIMLLKGY